MSKGEKKVETVRVKCPSCGAEYEARKDLADRFGCLNCPLAFCEVVGEAEGEGTKGKEIKKEENETEGSGTKGETDK